MTLNLCSENHASVGFFCVFPVSLLLSISDLVKAGIGRGGEVGGGGGEGRGGVYLCVEHIKLYWEEKVN